MSTTAAAIARLCSDPVAAAAIAPALVRFGEAPLRLAIRHGVRIVALRPAQRYADASAALRRLGVDVDRRPTPPAGLFVLEERTVYLRSRSPMTTAHEFGHALDCALGGGVYRSTYDARIRAAFAGARAFVTPYAATAPDEYFAESLRAYVEVNDPHSAWPHVSRAGLLAVDPPIYAAIESMLRECATEATTATPA